jgi:chitodextrinase
VRSDASNTQIYSGVALGTGWHSIKVCGTVGVSGTWDLFRDGVKIVNAWAANTGTTPVGRVEIGTSQAVTATINVDDVVVGSPQAPVDTDPPTAPGKPTGSSPSPGIISIAWAASQDASPPITYTVHRDGSSVGTTTALSFTDTGLTPGTQHTYTVDAVDSLDNGPSPMSPASDPITVATASAVFSDDFASGDFSNWTGVTRLTIDTGSGGVAPPSARLAVSGQSAFAYKNLPSTLSSICTSVNVNAASLGPNSPTLLRLRTAANGPIVRVYALTPSGILYVRSDASNTQIYSGVALGTGWHSIKVCGTVGVSGTWDLFRDGVKIVNAWAANTGTTPVGRVEIGTSQAVTATINVDDVVVGPAT